MPHFVLEYSDNLEGEIDLDHILKELRDTAIETGVFPVGGTRLRAISFKDYVIADGEDDYAFVHLTCILGHGRTMEVKQEATQKVFDKLTECLDEVYNSRLLAISFYVFENDPVLNYKQNNIHEYIKNKTDSS